MLHASHRPQLKLQHFWELESQVCEDALQKDRDLRRGVSPVSVYQGSVRYIFVKFYFYKVQPHNLMLSDRRMKARYSLGAPFVSPVRQKSKSPAESRQYLQRALTFGLLRYWDL